MVANPSVDRKHLVSTFLQGWTLERVLQHWLDEVHDLGVAPSQLVQVISVFRAQPSAPERRVEWWPKSGVEMMRRTLQEHVSAAPQGAHSVLPQSTDALGLRGQCQTIEYLLEVSGDPERTATVLLSASLFKRVESERARYPRDAWPHFSVAQTLLGWLRAKHAYRWDATCTSTLPAHDSESGLVISCMEQFLRFLAVEHARVLHRWAPVQITLREELENTQRHSIARIRAGAETQDANKRGRWLALDKAELEALIWSKPQREVARDFEVSEATVAKRCKLLGISKPVRGFWHKSIPPSKRSVGA